MHIQSRPLRTQNRHAADEIAQTNVRVFLLHALLRGTSQIHAAQRREILDEGAPAKKFAPRPVLLTRLRYLVKAAAAFSGWEDKLLV